MNIFLNTFFLFIFSFFLFYLLAKNRIKIFPTIFIKKKSDHNMHNYLILQNGGLIIIFFLIFAVLINYFNNEEINNIFNKIPRPYIFPFAIIILTTLSIIDFRKNIHPIIRLIVQFITVFISLTLVNFPLIDANILPLKFQYLLTIIFWIYIINITNFIDGIDGMATINILGIVLCILCLFTFGGYDKNLIFFISIILLPILTAFLIFNWPNAKFFMGDCGAIPLGFLVGYLLINLLAINQYFVFLIAFLYPILDVSLTLCKKTLKKITPWTRLFDYSFLQPVLKGNKKHFFVLKFLIMLIAINIISIILKIKYDFNSFILFLIILILNLLTIYYFNKFEKIKKS
jgi:UDP-N-acetylmuramyl pentapeptide phosphotransferase/UDP-N-acetylglucosamine-1-phosphate transferase